MQHHEETRRSRILAWADRMVECGVWEGCPPQMYFECYAK